MHRRSNKTVAPFVSALQTFIACPRLNEADKVSQIINQTAKTSQAVASSSEKTNEFRKTFANPEQRRMEIVYSGAGAVSRMNFVVIADVMEAICSRRLIEFNDKW